MKSFYIGISSEKPGLWIESMVHLAPPVFNGMGSSVKINDLN